MIRLFKKKPIEMTYQQALALPEFQKLYGLKDESIILAQKLSAAILAAQNRVNETEDFAYGEDVGNLFTELLFKQSDLEVEMKKLGKLYILPEQCQAELSIASTLWKILRN